MKRARVLGLVMMVGLLGAMEASAQSEPAEGSSATTPAKQSAAGGFYVPPPPKNRLEGGRVGGGTRSARPRCNTKLTAIAPEDHGGLTAEAQPTLYFFLSEATSCPVEFVLNDRRQVPPLVEATVKTPARAGLNAIRLADFGVSLEPDVEYDWFVQVTQSGGGGSPETFAGGQIRRVAPPADLAEALAKPGVDRARALGARSLFYDAVATLSEQIDASPDDAALRAQRAALFDSVGLGRLVAGDGGS